MKLVITETGDGFLIKDFYADDYDYRYCDNVSDMIDFVAGLFTEKENDA